MYISANLLSINTVSDHIISLLQSIYNQLPCVMSQLPRWYTNFMLKCENTNVSTLFLQCKIYCSPHTSKAKFQLCYFSGKGNLKASNICAKYVVLTIELACYWEWTQRTTSIDVNLHLCSLVNSICIFVCSTWQWIQGCKDKTKFKCYDLYCINSLFLRFKTWYKN